jgi:2-haloacid dehalogenase
MFDRRRIQALTFDCYGTLINWELGILKAIRPILSTYGKRPTDAELLRLYAQFEASEESPTDSDDHVPYRTILENVMARIGDHFGLSLIDRELERLPNSIATWPAFPDTAASLQALQQHFTLCICSNIDDDLFADTQPKLGVQPTWVVTAQYCRSYKPRSRHFRVAMGLLELAPDQILHVAQSKYHDIAPAKRLGMRTAWINRASAVPDIGVAPPTDVVPDLHFPDLATLTRELLM